MGFEVDLMVTGFKLNKCYTNHNPTRKIVIGDIVCSKDIPCLLTKVQGNEDKLQVNFFQKGDDLCSGNYSTQLMSLDPIPDDSFSIEGYVFQKKFTWEEELFPEIPKNNNNVVKFIYGFENNDKCINPVQGGFVRTSICARNFIGFGDEKSIDDLIMLDCDESYAYISYHGDIDCSELLFIQKFYTGLQYATQQEFCAKIAFIDLKVSFQCIKSIPSKYEHTNRGGTLNRKNMNGDYSFLELYRKSKADSQKNQSELQVGGWSCRGDKMVTIPTKNGECSGNQRTFGNESLYVIHIYDIEDPYCSDEPVAIHYADLEKMISFNPLNQRDNDFCLNPYFGDSDDFFFRKFVYLDEYSISSYKNNLAIIPNIDCEMEENEFKSLIIEYKRNPVRNFMLVHEDYCICYHNSYIFGGPEFNYHQGIRGYCTEGIPKLYYYGESEFDCQGYATDISNITKYNGICMDSHFITCLNYICYGIEAVDAKVCSGRGVCRSSDDCVCNAGYGGYQCERNLREESAIILSITFISFGALSIFFLIGIILIVVFCCFVSAKRKLKKFEGIEDIDVILSEQKLEKRTSIKQIKINKSAFEIQRKDLELISVLGEGGSDTIVYLCKWKEVKCAYKSFKNTMNKVDEDDFYGEFEKETKLFASILHPSILRFYGACLNPPNVGILLEYCSFGDIPSYLSSFRNSNQKKRSIEKKIRILKEIASGMFHLHSLGIIHRDLKPENVLIDDNENAKIMDFGLSRLTEKQDKTMTKQIGTSYYMAPEVYEGKQYSELCDVYSFAILVLVVISENYCPYGEDLNEFSLLRKVSSSPNFRPSIRKEDFKECEFLIPLIQKNWSKNVDERNSFEEIFDFLNSQEL